MAQRTFNIRLWFAVCSLGIIVLICSFSAHLLNRYMTHGLLQREGKLSQEFLESIIAVNGADTFRDDGTDASLTNPMLLDLAQHLLSMPGIIRVNVHAKSSRVLWSTEQQLIGKAFQGNDELTDAFKGSIVTEIADLEHLKEEHIALGTSGTMIESYIPIRADAGKGPIIGVVEFYRLPLSLQATLDEGYQMIWAGALIAATLLFLVLYWIVQRGARLIERQQESLGRMEALAAIGQMSSAVAHSLRNPMSSIRSSAELWQTQLPASERGVTSEIMAEVDRMESYVRDLLAYARSEAYQLQPVDPDKVIQAIIDKQARAAQRHHIAVRHDPGAGGGLRVLADERLLEQALTSLVTNAMEAMPEGGTLDIKVGKSPAAGRVRIGINDTGRGIPEDMLKRVTESYFTTKARGLGLGLVLAKGVIERFGGNLDISSVADVGTSVSVDLKAA
ncbi:MAG: hypothetical protein K2Y29_08095 [Beijerinckiaceae bacterium]|nr:hypothetical protein [Beijerinckiaceae bacterium]